MCTRVCVYVSVCVCALAGCWSVWMAWGVCFCLSDVVPLVSLISRGRARRQPRWIRCWVGRHDRPGMVGWSPVNIVTICCGATVLETRCDHERRRARVSWAIAPAQPNPRPSCPVPAPPSPFCPFGPCLLCRLLLLCALLWPEADVALRNERPARLQSLTLPD